MLEGKLHSGKNYYRPGGHEDKKFGRWLRDTGLDIDPLTGKEVSGPVRAACLWAAADTKRFESYVGIYPRALTVCSLHNLYPAERKGGKFTPSLYVYRMLGPLSGELLEPQICKIGCTDNGAAARVNAQTRKAAVGYLQNMELELKCRHPRRLEKLLHKKFGNRQVKALGREWFEVSPGEVEEALKEMERHGLLWRDGEWINMGRKPVKVASERHSSTF